jgi:hypothetical protein
VKPKAQTVEHWPRPLQSSPPGQNEPQVPQFWLSVSRFAQIPLQGVPLVQALAQTPSEQTWPTGQVWPQEPQLSASSKRLAQ